MLFSVLTASVLSSSSLGRVMELSSGTSMAAPSALSSPVELMNPPNTTISKPCSSAIKIVDGFAAVTSTSPLTRLGIIAAPPIPELIVTSRPLRSQILSCDASQIGAPSAIGFIAMVTGVRLDSGSGPVVGVEFGRAKCEQNSSHNQ